MIGNIDSAKKDKTSTRQLHEAIITRLRAVIDPETNADVIRMHLVNNIQVETGGHIRYTFQPSSPLCPIAVFLAGQIKSAISEVPGVMSQQISVQGYVAAAELTQLLNNNLIQKES